MFELRRLSLLSLGLLVFAHEATLAGTILVPEDQPTIAAGLAAAASGDTVSLARQTFFEHSLTFPAGVSLIGRDSSPSAQATIDAQGQGGILYADYWDYPTGTLRLEGITFRHSASSNGAVCLRRGDRVEIRDCRFLDNSAPSGLSAAGLTIAWMSNLTMQDCEFVGNSSTTYSSTGGARIIANAVEVENCQFVDNHGDYAGALATASFGANSTRITGCSFAYNSAPRGGAVYLLYFCQALIERCAITYSLAGSAICLGSSDTAVDLDCSLLWGNATGDWVGPYAGELLELGNLHVEPAFCGGPGSSDLRLQASSPCLPENNSCGLLIGAEAAICGTSAAAETSWGAIKARY